MQRFVGFIGPSYVLRSVNVDAQRCVNLYPELNELGTGKEREVAALVGRPGLKKLATLGSGPFRGLHFSSKNRTFAVSGTGFYEVTTPTAPSLIATLTTGSGRVGMADNGVDLVVVDGAKGYHFTFATDTWAEITDPEFPPGANVAQFLDQYIIVNEPGSGKFWFSAISDATSWDGLDFAQAESFPDNMHTPLVDHEELILAGDQTIETFFNSGDASNPFQRARGRLIEEGAIPATLQKLDNTVLYVNRSEKGQGTVKRIQGALPQRISTHAVELAIAGYGDISDATSYSYQDKGHSFYVLNFPGAKTTWAFDISTGLWSERTYTPADGSGEQRDRVECHVFDGTRHLVGDWENGNLYQYDDETYTDDGAPITWRRRAPHISAEGRRITINAMQLDIESGVGLASGNGSDPKMFLRASKNGGHTWGNERETSMGKQGEYTQRAIWRRLGQARDWVLEAKSTEPVKQVWVSAFLEMEAAAH